MFKIRDKRSKGWFTTDNEYTDKFARYLKPIATCVYQSLCRHADKEQECFPGEELIAQEQGMTSRSVRKGIQRLEKCHIIVVYREKDKNKRFKNNVYVLLDKSEWLIEEAKSLDIVEQKGRTVTSMPEECSSSGKPEEKYAKSRRNQFPDKETKNTNKTQEELKKEEKEKRQKARKACERTKKELIDKGIYKESLV